MSAPSQWFTLRRPGALVAPAASIVLFIGLAVDAGLGRGPLNSVDVHIAVTLNRVISGHPVAVSFWRNVTRAGSPVTWDTAAAVVVIVLLVRQRRRLAVLGVVSLAGAAVLSTIMKTIVGRPRPHLPVAVDHAGGVSFPSGHAMTSLVAVGFLLVAGRSIAPRFVRPAVVAAAGVVVVVIGFSRLVLGVHYVTDVVGGWLAGAVWLGVTLVVVGCDDVLAFERPSDPSPAVWICSDATSDDLRTRTESAVRNNCGDDG